MQGGSTIEATPVGSHLTHQYNHSQIFLNVQKITCGRKLKGERGVLRLMGWDRKIADPHFSPAAKLKANKLFLVGS